jgi:ribosomal-protein-alanine N-acetyltransferase
MAVRQYTDPPRIVESRQPDWHRGLPSLANGGARLRELRAADAASLLRHVSTPSVCRYIAPAPSTLEGFRRFIRWTKKQRRAGTHLCFGIVPRGQTDAVGVLQIWPIEEDFSTAEWGFALGETFWGTGLFSEAVQLMLQFAFETLGVFRLEARAVDANVRGNGVLRKLGATREGVLRGGFKDGDAVIDHVMWSILAPEWLALRSRSRTTN